MGNACNCMSKDDQGKEINLTSKDKKDEKGKKDSKVKPQDHDESEVHEDGDEDKEELVNAAIKIQVLPSK